MQELQVETYGGMERQEKTEFILEQMRLCLLNKDYIRVQIISKKISARYFESEEEDVSIVLLCVIFSCIIYIISLSLI